MIGKGIIGLVLVLIWVISGCQTYSEEGQIQTFFERKSTEIESRAILNELSQIRENPHIANPLPDIYRDEPARLPVSDGVKLFYFTKHHPADSLGGQIKGLGFKVSSNSSTNQLIIHCKDNGECDQVLEFLKRTDVPPIQVHIDCLILERFGDITMDWETTLLIENLFGEEITIGADKYPRPAFPGASLRESRRSDFGLDFGLWSDKGLFGHQFRLVVDLLESRGYLKILLNPTLETVNGKTATVMIRDNAPIELLVTAKGSSEQNNTISYTLTDYKWVADTLKVTPQVYADGSIGLKTDITIGSKSKPEGVVQSSIITERSIQVKENRIEPGKSLVIGGMRKSENRSVIRGVPGLKDIPLLGILFSSKDFEEKATEIIFILTPSISSGSVSYAETAQMIREKYETPDYGSTLEDLFGDPIGTKMYSEMMEKQAEEARANLVKARRDAEEAERLAREQQLHAERARREAIRHEERMKQAQDRIRKAQQQLEEAVRKAESEQAQSQEQKALLEKLEQEMQQARQQAQQALQEAEASQKQVEEAEARARHLEQEAARSEQEAERLRQQAEELEQEPPQEKTDTEESSEDKPI